MDIRTAFPSANLKAADLQGEAIKFKIKTVTMEDVGSDRKPVAYFLDDGRYGDLLRSSDGKERGLVLNKTNGEAIAADFGWNTDNWTGKVIELFPAKTQFNGQMVDAIRVRVPKQKPATASVAPNARARAEAAPPTPPVTAYEDELDDEIPF
jgi:hypothetical protein